MKTAYSKSDIGQPPDHMVIGNACLCGGCRRIYRAIVAHLEQHGQPSLLNVGAEAYRRWEQSVPPLDLPPEDYDHFAPGWRRGTLGTPPRLVRGGWA